MAPSIYYANHTSHLDFVVLWASLPDAQRVHTVPVAAKEYWEANRLRHWIAHEFFRAVLIDRQHVRAGDNPLDAMEAVLTRGESLIVFPEGTRSLDGVMRAFKPGLYHLARRRPDIPLVPVCLENLNRVLPKGESLPVPLLSAITFGDPLYMIEGEQKGAFLVRAAQAIEELKRHE